MALLSRQSSPASADFEFLTSRSRVVRVIGNSIAQINPRPISIWAANDRGDSVWALFRSHQEACAALSLSGPAMTVLPALETDLQHLSRLELYHQRPLHSSASNPDLYRSARPEYISSNPPNPRANFRLGDWICSSPNCAAHNFGRNVVCIGCGSPRSKMYHPTRPLQSPRFASNAFSLPNTPHATSFPAQPRGAHPLLTPSGRAFAVGGRVQNISSDPLAPCIMYWPDNEPFPEQGQIRPSSVVRVPQPPILNTGNKGPISHQPGDWICKKCNYLNWRRRKVCQTCLPYAEGNGDSISAAVQAERIALLTAVLAQSPSTPPPPALRSQSMTPPQVQRSFMDVSPPHLRAPVHRSQSHFDLGTQYANDRPIYQTPSPPIYRTPRHEEMNPPLLPSFLQEIVTSPALSPASTSSADLSFEEYSPTFRHVTKNSSSSNSSIWTLDGEETKSLLRGRSDLSGGSRKSSLEHLRD